MGATESWLNPTGTPRPANHATKQFDRWRPSRCWKKRRINAHIYLNYLCLWLVKYIENQWRARGYTGEVVPTLRRWDQALRYTELLDKDHKTAIGYEWTRGEQARQTIQEIRELEEQGKIQPALWQLQRLYAEVELKLPSKKIALVRTSRF